MLWGRRVGCGALVVLGDDELVLVVVSLPTAKASRFSSSARRACSAATSVAVGTDDESL